jgi:ABC-type phosphonate transport system ATPase subunit
VRQLSDEAAVMTGQDLERGPTERVLDDPRYPCTRLLVMPSRAEDGAGPKAHKDQAA